MSKKENFRNFFLNFHPCTLPITFIFLFFMSSKLAVASLNCGHFLSTADASTIIYPQGKFKRTRVSRVQTNVKGAAMLNVEFHIESEAALIKLMDEYKAVNPYIKKEEILEYFKTSELSYPQTIPLEALLPPHIRDPKLSQNKDINCLQSTACFDDPYLALPDPNRWSLSSAPFTNAMRRQGKTEVIQLRGAEGKILSSRDFVEQDLLAGDAMRIWGKGLNDDHAVKVLQRVGSDYLVYSKEGSANAKISYLSDVLQYYKATGAIVYR